MGFNPQIFSAYSLILEPNTQLYKNKNRFVFPSEDEECDMYYGMTAPRGWEWFTSVRKEDRFKEYIHRAKELAEKYK